MDRLGADGGRMQRASFSRANLALLLTACELTSPFVELTEEELLTRVARDECGAKGSECVLTLKHESDMVQPGVGQVLSLLLKHC